MDQVGGTEEGSLAGQLPLKPQTESEDTPYEPEIEHHTDSESDVCINQFDRIEQKNVTTNLLTDSNIFRNLATKALPAVKQLSEVTITTAVNIICVSTDITQNLNAPDNYIGTRYVYFLKAKCVVPQRNMIMEHRYYRTTATGQKNLTALVRLTYDLRVEMKKLKYRMIKIF